MMRAVALHLIAERVVDALEDRLGLRARFGLRRATKRSDAGVHVGENT
jgi:hypothetical protein